MSTVIYARKDADGCIVALSLNPDDLTDSDWSALPNDDPEAIDFIEKLADMDNVLHRSDMSFVRVLEDVIDLLIARDVIRFTDLPLPAQTKLLQRRDRRRQRQGLQLFSDEELI
jgi:hypothetical protein